jgi:hypothetical protein
LLNGRELAEFKQPDTTFKTQIFMHSSPSLQTTRLICLLIAIAGAVCPLASKADDTATATTPVTTNVTVAATVPETTNAPELATAPETTNTPAPAAAPETTNTSAVAPAPETTNAPPPATALATTNPPVAATAPTITNMSATVPVPVSTNMPAAATVPVSATTPTNVTTMPATATPVTAPPKTTQTPWAMTPPPYQPFTLGAEAGTTGFGGAASWRFADHFGLVGGADYFSYSLSRTIQSIPYSANVRLMTERAGVNLYPSKDSSFYISLGAYFNQNRLTGTAISDGSLTVDGTPVPAGESVHLEYKQQPVDPYASIGGNLYFDKARHFSLGYELGAFYLGNPKVHVTCTDSSVDTSSNQKQVEDAIKKFPVWPILKLSLNYSF